MSLNWYVLRAISGKENKIKTYLEKERDAQSKSALRSRSL